MTTPPHDSLYTVQLAESCSQDDPQLVSAAAAAPVIANFTPHTITLIHDDGSSTQYPPTGHVARVTEIDTPFHIDSWPVPIVRKQYGAVEGIPADYDYDVGIVSILAKQADPTNNRHVVPDTGPKSVVRDGSGAIVGVKRFMVL